MNRQLTLALAVLLGPPLGAQYTISTIAGGAFPNNVPALSVSFSPQVVALDAAGNLYAADATAIYRITPAGMLTVIAGPAAAFSAIGGMAIDAAGNVYVSDTGNNRVRKIDAKTGGIATVAGGGGAGDGSLATSAQLGGPWGIAIDTSGDLYIAEIYGQRVRKVSAATGRITTVAEGLNGPQRLAIDQQNHLYVFEAYGYYIRRIDLSSNVISTIAGMGSPGYSGDGGSPLSALLSPAGAMTCDPAGNLYLADTSNHVVRKITADLQLITTIAGSGLAGFTGDGGPALNALLNRPTALAADGNGSLFVNDCGNGRIRRIILSTGTIVGVAGAGYAGFGGDGGPAADAIFRGCGGLAVSGANLLYIADSDNYRVRQIALPGGMVTTVTGAGVPGFRPYGLTADSAGNVFISDTNSNRVLAYHAKASTIATIAGDGTFAFGGDQGPAVRAQLATPSSVALDAAGNLFIADAANHRIRRVDAYSGVIATIAGTGNYAHSGDGGPAASADIASPSGLAFDPSGNLYFLESTLGYVRRISPSGIIATIAGGGTGGDGPALNARLVLPAGLAVDATGNIYISEPPVNRLRKLAAPAGSLAIANTVLPPGAVGSPYSVIMSATGGAPPYRAWNILVGTLPLGLALDSDTGVLAGSPSATGSFEFTVQVSDQRGARVNRDFKLSVAPAGFLISAQNVVHAATLQTGPIAPGEIITVFGSVFGPATIVSAAADASGQFPTLLSDTRVLFDNVSAPLIYAASSQVSAVAPYGIAGQTSTMVQVEYMGKRSNQVAIPVTPLRPGIFTQDSSGVGQALAFNEDGSPNSAANPAAARSLLTIYATGLGVLTPAATDGSRSSAPLGIPAAPVRVTMDGLDASIYYAGAAPAAISGLIQVNLQVPGSAASGGALPVVLIAGDIGSVETVTVAVK